MEQRTPVAYQDNGGKEMKYRLLRYVYDQCGNQVEVHRFLDYQTMDSANGRVHRITRTFDRSNRLIKVSDSTGACMEYQYNGHNQRISEKLKINDKVDSIKVYTYSKTGRLYSVSASADRKGCGKAMAETCLSYDKNGNVILIKTPSGNEIRREYNAADRLISETHVEKKGGINNTTRFEYDPAGNITAIINAAGNKMTHSYDLMNRRTLSKGIDGGITYVRYDRNGRVDKVISPNSYKRNAEDGKGYRYHYNLEDRPLEVFAPNNKLEKSYRYNLYGELEQMTDGSGSGVQLQYDFAGRRTKIITAGNSTQEYEYDVTGNTTAVVDGVGNRTGYELDQWGRIIKIHMADGSTEAYGYDYVGNVTEAMDGEGHCVHYDYNALNKLATRTDAAGMTESYSYDIEGRVSEYTDRNGGTTHFEYNMYGNPVRKCYQQKRKDR